MKAQKAFAFAELERRHREREKKRPAMSAFAATELGKRWYRDAPSDAFDDVGAWARDWLRSRFGGEFRLKRQETT